MLGKTRSKRFRKGKFKDAKRILFYDLEALLDCMMLEDKNGFLYHWRLIKGNLQDLYGEK